MNDGASSIFIPAVATALAGLVFGLVYFRALRRTVELHVAGRGWLGPVALSFARIAGAVIVLTFMARLGALPLLSGFFGFLLARGIALRAARRAD